MPAQKRLKTMRAGKEAKVAKAAEKKDEKAAKAADQNGKKILRAAAHQEVLKIGRASKIATTDDEP